MAGGNVDGCHNICSGYTAGGHGSGLLARNRGELAVVEFPAVRNDDCFSVCAALEAIGAAHGCAIYGNAIHGKTGSVSARISSDLFRIADELRDSGLGD